MYQDIIVLFFFRLIFECGLYFIDLEKSKLPSFNLTKWERIGFYLMALILAPIFEEIVFRYFPFHFLEDTIEGHHILIISSTTFGIMHIFNGIIFQKVHILLKIWKDFP